MQIVTGLFQEAFGSAGGPRDVCDHMEKEAQKHSSAIDLKQAKSLGNTAKLLLSFTLFTQGQRNLTSRWVGERNFQIGVRCTAKSSEAFWQEPCQRLHLCSWYQVCDTWILVLGRWTICHVSAFLGSCFPTALANLDQAINTSDSYALSTLHTYASSHTQLSGDQCKDMNG